MHKLLGVIVNSVPQCLQQAILTVIDSPERFTIPLNRSAFQEMNVAQHVLTHIWPKKTHDPEENKNGYCHTAIHVAEIIRSPLLRTSVVAGTSLSFVTLRKSHHNDAYYYAAL
jgi:hypothetical protein